METEPEVQAVEPETPSPEGQSDAEPAAEVEETTGAPEEVEVTEVPPPKKDGVQARIDELTREKWAAIREAAKWEGIAQARAEKPVEVAPPPVPEKPLLPPVRPRLADFDTNEEYEEAVDKYEADKEEFITRKALKEVEAREYERQTKTEAQKAQERYDRTLLASKNAGIKKYPDFMDTVTTGAFVSNEVFNLVLAVDEDKEPNDTMISPDLAYYLAKNPQVAQRFNTMAATSPMKAAVELGKLAVKFSSPPKPKKVSEAPEPTAPIEGTVVSAGKTLEEMTTAERIAYWNEQEFGRKG